MPGVTAVPDVVDAPTIGTATGTSDGSLTASVTFTAATTGGAASSYGAISDPDSLTGTSATSPITVSGLTADTAYTFQVYGINSSGTWSSIKSAASNSATSTDPSATFLIQRVAGTGSSGTITFSSIPSTYTHLQIRYIARSDAATTNRTITIRLNSDSASNYAYHNLYGDGASVTASGANATTGMIQRVIPAASATSNVMGVGLIDIHDYASTTKNKTLRSITGTDCNGIAPSTDWQISLQSGLWVNTNAITSISLISSTGNFTTASTFALYGVKGS